MAKNTLVIVRIEDHDCFISPGNKVCQVCKAEVGALRVYHIQNVPGKAAYYKARTPGEAAALIVRLAKADLRNPRVSDNVLGLEVMESDGQDGWGWYEWFSEDSEDIDLQVDALWETRGS